MFTVQTSLHISCKEFIQICDLEPLSVLVCAGRPSVLGIRVTIMILSQFYAALLLTHRLQKVTLHLLLYIPPFVFVTRCSLHVSALNFVVCWNHIRKSSSPLCCPLCCNWAENKNQCQKDLYFSLHLRILNCNHRLKLRPTGHYATEWLIHKHQGPPSDRPILVVDIKLSPLRTDIFRHCKRITGCFRDMWRWSLKCSQGSYWRTYWMNHCWSTQLL